MKTFINYYGGKFSTAQVFLDGIAQTFVTIADEEQGYIEKYFKDSFGKFVVQDKDTLEVVRLHGVVKITQQNL